MKQVSNIFLRISANLQISKIGKFKTVTLSAINDVSSRKRQKGIIFKIDVELAAFVDNVDIFMDLWFFVFEFR